MISLNFLNISISDELIEALKLASKEVGIERVAVVGGVIRDNFVKTFLNQSLTSSKDLDICVEGSAYALAKKIETNLGKERVSIIRINAKYSTVQLIIDNLQIDIATARKEIYLSPGENPQITFGELEEDLGRRDFTINAMALDLTSTSLIDPYNGRDAIKNRQLEFIHFKSVEEDPTRIVRGARYVSRLNLTITSESLKQIKSTIKRWPWGVKQNQKIVPALGTRLRMEFELLLQEKSFSKALKSLQDWGALVLLDEELQNDDNWETRLNCALKLGLHPLTGFIAKSPSSHNLAKRLQMPQKQQRLLAASAEFQRLFSDVYESKEFSKWNPSTWCQAIESTQCHPDVVAIAICVQHPFQETFLQWLQDWKQIKSPISAKELIKKGWEPGPLLKEELQRLRFQKLDSLY
tara:strand:+ start:905 stop:2131 length:1227 start_codon:yes stop_codon:yes gene_type:complete